MALVSYSVSTHSPNTTERRYWSDARWTNLPDPKKAGVFFATTTFQEYLFHRGVDGAKVKAFGIQCIVFDLFLFDFVSALVSKDDQQC